MAGKFLHEEIYRGPETLSKLAQRRITICGAGALGSHLADNLVRQGFRQLSVVDCDRIEEHNVGTQLYEVGDVGARKVDVLRNRLFRAVEVEIETVAKRLNDRNARSLLKGADIVIDTFDNSDSRGTVHRHCREARIECLHVGLHADYCEIVWNDRYRVPADVAGDVCEYPLARNLVLLAVAIAAETLLGFIVLNERTDRCATLRDFAVRRLEQPG